MIESSLVLAAGRGSRLDVITREKPKGAVELDGKPLIEHAELALRKANLPLPLYATGYRSEYFESLGKPTVHNREWSSTNMFFSMLLGLRVVNLPCLVLYSDIFLGPDSLREFREVDQPAIGYVQNWRHHWSSRYQNPLTDAETFLVDSFDRVVEIGGALKSVQDANGQFAGVFVVTKELYDAFEYLYGTETKRAKALSSTEVFSHLMAIGFEFRAVEVREPWFELDNRQDLDFAIGELGSERGNEPRV